MQSNTVNNPTEPVILDLAQATYYIHSNGDVYSEKNSTMPQMQVGNYYKQVPFKGKYRKLSYVLNNRGYYAVGIAGQTKMVHRLVAEYFVPNTDNKPFVNHKDGNKLNNHYSNLEWVTNAENCHHAYTTGLVSDVGKQNSKQALLDHNETLKLPQDVVEYIRKVHKPRDKEFSGYALSKKFNVTPTTISNIVNFKYAYH